MVRRIVEWMKVTAHWMKEFETHPRWLKSHLIDILFHLIYMKYSGVLFPNDHFEPTPFPYPSNALSLTPLIGCSLSLSPSLSVCSHSVSTSWHLIYILRQFCRRYHWINLIEQTWCFTWWLLTITFLFFELQCRAFVWTCKFG